MFVLWSIQIFWMWPPKMKEPLGPFISLVCAYIKCWWCFVVQSLSCVWLCDPMDCSKPDFPVLYCLPECAQISRLLSQWYYLTISSSATLFSFCLQSCPASGVFPMSWLFTSGGQALSLLYGPALTSVHDYWKNHSWCYFSSMDCSRAERLFLRFFFFFLIAGILMVWRVLYLSLSLEDSI